MFDRSRLLKSFISGAALQTRQLYSLNSLYYPHLRNPEVRTNGKRSSFVHLHLALPVQSHLAVFRRNLVQNPLSPWSYLRDGSAFPEKKTMMHKYGNK